MKHCENEDWIYFKLKTVGFYQKNHTFIAVRIISTKYDRQHDKVFEDYVLHFDSKTYERKAIRGYIRWYCGASMCDRDEAGYSLEYLDEIPGELKSLCDEIQEKLRNGDL